MKTESGGAAGNGWTLLWELQVLSLLQVWTVCTLGHLRELLVVGYFGVGQWH